MKETRRDAELVIIFAVLIIVALIVLSVFIGILRSQSYTNIQQSQAYWETAEIGIIDYSFSSVNNELRLVLQNNQPSTMAVNEIIVGESVNSTTMTILPKGNAAYTLSKECDKGEIFNLPVTVNYNDIADNDFTFVGAQNLIGKCLR